MLMRLDEDGFMIGDVRCGVDKKISFRLGDFGTRFTYGGD